ncbi:lamin tail domain-containing protein 2 [Elephas maximus indicus]|uniref:lamin tail domain-containing protein 2 n=1 Tax=Elephas maximus indicus TaxID=99487 RepID=UPI002115FFDF|nr:lamin tail domain-containing protein 2 [Elephas maximus indicus]
MAPKFHQDAEEAEEEMLSSLVDREQVHGGLGSPAGAVVNPVAPTGQQGTKPQSSQIFPINLRAAPESLDPRTLRLLWGQRELEIQALRWAVQGSRDGRYYRILQEVAGLPPERSGVNQEKFLQNQVQKLTLELKEQKKQARLEKEQLEQQLLQTLETVRQLEVELQTFQKSCLLQLARSSWVGRILRSQTGSVEVVTAETLMDPSDSSENELVPAGEGFQLKDVDWNSVAQRYPNLFTEAVLLEHKQPRPPPQPPLNEWDSESRPERTDGHTKSVEWSILPFGSSSSGATDSDTRSSQLSIPSRVQKVTGHPPGESSCFSFQLTKGQEKTLSADRQAVPAGAAGRFPWLPPPGVALLCRQLWALTRTQEGCLLSLLTSLCHSWCHPLSCGPSGCCKPGAGSQAHSQWPLHIGFPWQTGLLSLDLRKTLAEEPEQTVLLPKASEDSSHQPHRLTGSCLKIVAVSRREKFVRVLNQSLEETADLGGFVLQQFVRGFPVCMYRFPSGTLLEPRHHITVWGEGTSRTKKHPPASLGRESVNFHSSLGYVTLLLNPKGEVLSEYQAPHCVTPVSRSFSDNSDLSIDRFPLSEAPPGSDTGELQRGSRSPCRGRARGSRADRGRQRWGRTRVFLPLLSSNKLFHRREGPGRLEGAEAEALEPLPAIPETRPGFDNQAKKKHTVQVCRKGVDRNCPMVALSVQTTAESRYGFRFLSCPPITVDACGRV